MKLNYISIGYSVDGKYCPAKIKESCIIDGVEFDVRIKDDRFTLIIRSQHDISLSGIYAEFDYQYDKNCRLFFNGYQSWTDSKEQTVNGRMYRLNRFPGFLIRKYQLKAYGDMLFTRYGRKKGQMHGFSYAYVREGGDYTLFGSLCEHTGFTVIRSDTKKGILAFEKDCTAFENGENSIGGELRVTGEYKALDIAICRGSEDEVFDRWFSLLGTPKPRGKRISGYTSWYNHYDRINERTIKADLDGFKAAGIKPDVFQIDDGYQQKVGDWLCIDDDKFPNGMKAVADSIRAEGIIPGLWLAPFAAAKDSQIANEHKDWLVTDGYYPIVCGSNWGGFYALDIYNEEVREYLRHVFDVVINRWGYGLVKLDFLYAACIMPRRNKTRGEIMHDALVFLREICGDALILGCGVPLVSAFGLVDYCRVGCDVSLLWDDVFYAKHMHRERISTKNTLLDTIYRRQLDGRAFRNDPDVFLLRKNNIKLSNEQKKTLAVVNALYGGVLFTSDNVAEYDTEQRKMYDMLQKLDKDNVLSVDTDGRKTTVKYGYFDETAEIIIKH